MTDKIDWKSKLTSRKFWMAGVGLVTGLLGYFKVDADKVEQIGGLILTAASIIAYIIGEGLADSARAENSTPVAILAPTKENQDDDDFAEREISDHVPP